jgi:undecaprenyl diphosphate synthase
MQKSNDRLHVAIIMDGNGRRAQARGRSRTAGHRAGARAVRRVVEAAPGLGIGTLSLYAFSADNWKRPAEEVATLMRLLRRFLREERRRCVNEGVRVNVVGRRDRLAPDLLAEIAATECATRHGTTLHLRIAVDYSSRQAILAAAARPELGRLSPADFSRRINDSIHSAPAAPAAPDVDLVVRTSGEQRLSDFLLWESAYAELLFTDTMWPEFDGHDLAAAVREFRGRQRRFGGLPPAAGARAAGE